MVRKHLVNKPTDPVQLKILFPSIKFAIGGVPAYGKLLYTDFDFPLSSKTEVVLYQSSSGFNMDSHLGLLGFLRESGYMAPSKIGRFEAAGRDKVVDSVGRVVTPAGIFNRNPDVVTMYFFCSTLRVANRVFVDEGIDAGYLLDVLEGSLYQRLLEADRYGHKRILEKVLQLMDSFYSTDLKFSARRGSNGVSGFDRMARLMNSFNVQGFRDFSLSGDIIEDVYSFLCLFP